MEERRLLALGRAAAVAAEAREWLRRRTDYALDRRDYAALQGFEQRTAGAEWRGDFPPGTRELPAIDAPFWDTYAALLASNPAEAYARMDIPTLVVLGAEDQRILAERHVPEFERLAAASSDFTIRVIPGASHGLLLSDADGRQSYPPGLYQGIVDWVVERVRRVR
jgi:pimeloyl-ACP methyl ester carboxylesterase